VAIDDRPHALLDVGSDAPRDEVLRAAATALAAELVAIGPGAPSGPTVVLTGHLDTVGVEGMPSPFTPVVEGWVAEHAH